MKTLRVYEPAMCCSTGVCGPSVDPDLVAFAGLLSQLASAGAQIERHNLAHEPQAFVRNPTVRTALESEGPGVLPLLLLDDAVFLRGRYPTASERRTLFQEALERPAPATA